MANIDQEGNIISPLGCFKLVPRTVSTSASPRSSSKTTTAYHTTMISTCSAFSSPALATLQPPAAAKAAVTTTTTSCATMLSTADNSPPSAVLRVHAPVPRSRGRFTTPPQLASSQVLANAPVFRSGGKFAIPPKLGSREALSSKDKANTEMIKKLMAALEDRDITISKLRLENPPKLANTEQIMRYESALLDMKTVLGDRDTTITRLESEVDSITTAQTQRLNEVSTLSNNWVNLVMQLRSQSSSQIQEMRAAITAKDSQLKHQRREITRLSTKVATLTHDNNVAHLALQQNSSTYSPSTTESVSITGSVFDSTVSDFEPETLEITKSPDVSLAAPTQITRRREESGQITMMLDSVDKLAKHYSPKHRYHQPNTTNLSQLRSTVVPDSLFNYEMAALWMFAQDPTEEEMVQYDHHLEQELRPAPVYSPPLRRPYVNWTNLNKHRRKNLPDPQLFPVSSVPVDPTYYTDTARYKPADYHTIHSYCGPVPLRLTKEECGCVKCVPPFGQKYGLMTDMGIIGMPTEPVHGYCWDDDTGGWVIATGCC